MLQVHHLPMLCAGWDIKLRSAVPNVGAEEPILQFRWWRMNESGSGLRDVELKSPSANLVGDCEQEEMRVEETSSCPEIARRGALVGHLLA